MMEDDDEIYRATRAFKNWQKVRDIVKNKNIKKSQQFYHLFQIEH